MAKASAPTTTVDISKYTKPSDLPERVMKTIRTIAIASAVVFSTLAFSATPGSAARMGRSITSPQDYCYYDDAGFTDCSFRSYAQCQATASGRAGGCYADYFPYPDDEGLRGARAQMSSRPRH
jgi:hypothetical protein